MVKRKEEKHRKVKLIFIFLLLTFLATSCAHSKQHKEGNIKEDTVEDSEQKEVGDILHGEMYDSKVYTSEDGSILEVGSFGEDNSFTWYQNEDKKSYISGVLYSYKDTEAKKKIVELEEYGITQEEVDRVWGDNFEIWYVDNIIFIDNGEPQHIDLTSNAYYFYGEDLNTFSLVNLRTGGIYNFTETRKE